MPQGKCTPCKVRYSGFEKNLGTYILDYLPFVGKSETGELGT